MLASNTSKNFALIVGWTHRSPARNAGSSFTVSSEHFSVSSLQVNHKFIPQNLKHFTVTTVQEMEVLTTYLNSQTTYELPAHSG